MGNNINLQPTWNAILDVYKEFAKVCERHDLRFYLTDGSAIGAVRHHGFIPWDDDLDVSMPREDYEEFMRVASNELPRHLCCLSIGRTPGYPLLHGKVQETRREVVEAVEKQAGYTLSNGIFIDIFPFDGWSGSGISCRVNQLKYFLLNCARRCQQCMFVDIKEVKSFIKWLVGCVSRILYGDLLDNVKFSLASQNVYGVRPVRESPWTARVRFWLDRRLLLRADVWGSPVMMDFCGLQVPLPERYDEYLRQDYGDYMKLPPVEQRKTTHSCDDQHVSWWIGVRV